MGDVELFESSWIYQKIIFGGSYLVEFWGLNCFSKEIDQWKWLKKYNQITKVSWSVEYAAEKR